MSHLTPDLVATLGDALDYSHPDTSLSPFFSSVGLGCTDQPGIYSLHLHYNRLTTTLGLPLLPVPGVMQGRVQTALGVEQHLDTGCAAYAFYDHNAWLVDCAGLAEVEFRWRDLRIAEQYTGLYFPFAMASDSSWLSVPPDYWGAETTPSDPQTRLFGAYLPTPDDRDPDRSFPFILGVRAVRGVVADTGEEDTFRVAADPSGRIVLAFAASILDVTPQAIQARLQAAPADVAAARERTRTWFDTTLGDLSLAADDSREAHALASAAHALMLNMVQAPGRLAGRVAVSPSRGGYPAHFLWDACFQSLALAEMQTGLAEDSLLLLTENTRFDGKMPQFVCSTWVRPNESQPPLVGWASLKLVRRRDNLDLARRLLPVLQRNTRWWLTHRMTRYGLIGTASGFETGWDNSPRFDHGPIVTCDMNSYLLSQMRVCAELAALIGDEATAAASHAQAETYAQRMVDVLYDADRGRFTERLMQTGERLPLKTPALFLPLWAGVPLTEGAARRSLEGSLLNPAHFFGRFPFPCVAYDEPAYDPTEWWRGPVWPSIAYLMLETLDRYGYHVERRQTARRLYDMVLANGQFAELFNSATGEGLGCQQQGWTAAIFLKLHQELSQ